MTQVAHATFPHRRNPNGTFDSICTQCFRTIATAATEADLKTSDIVHNCFGFDLGGIMRGAERERRPNRPRQSSLVESQGIPAPQ